MGKLLAKILEMSYYPTFLDIRGKRCVVIGGGEVALRKVGMLLEFGGRVEVISPELCPDLAQFEREGKVKTIRRDYRSGDLERAFVVIAATDSPAVNEQVAREASERGALINVVDVPKLSNFIVPSYLRRGDITVAVSTSGKSPALARKIRTELERQFGEDYATLVAVVEEVRTELKAKGIAVSARSWQEALDLPNLLMLLRYGERNQVKERLLKALMEARSR